VPEIAPRAFRTLRAPGSAELEIKHSRFLGMAGPARDEAQVQAILAEARLAHPDASTHCFAYRLGPDGAQGRFSDGGEPGGTAGRPMMEVLIREALVDVLVVVTRYFGGTLLGAGGLARAFGQTAAAAIHAATAVAMQPHTVLRITVAYGQLGALERALLAAGLRQDGAQYTDAVTVTVPVPTGTEGQMAAIVADLSGGAGAVRPGETVYLPGRG